MRPRVILAEDHTDIAARIQRLLSVAFTVVDVVVSGEALIARTEALCPDAILTDLWLDGLDGISATRELRRRYPTLPIVVMSADIDPTLQACVVAAGASRFVSKPEVLESIVGILRGLVVETTVSLRR